ncbi:hypothetical protein E3N88_08285 [Mikania micrantha]|uniref:Uncharacterized protein n=1 Tax=Mikania micrantha TaxID=192012 RepID=A0A5N6PFR2_9ASTR|nr:hypothetical protein E3N88_08285 [Mikania micrantha]
MASSDNNEELLEVVVYTGGKWYEEPGPIEDTRNAEYKPYNGATIEKHHFKMPVNFTYSMLHENVERAIGITDEYDATHFRDHLANHSAKSNPVEVYNEVHHSSA